MSGDDDLSTPFAELYTHLRLAQTQPNATFTLLRIHAGVPTRERNELEPVFAAQRSNGGG